jgi:membrane protease YdiL (CAAX protease family)
MNEVTEPATRPLWKRIAQFPLVAMVSALLLGGLAMAAAGLVSKLLPLFTGDARVVESSLLELVFVFAIYKLAIRHLGRHPKDDLPLAGAMPRYAHGLLLGTLIVTLIVVTAASLHAYMITGPGGTSALLSAVFGIAIMPGFREELFFRGILFRWLEEFGGSWFALALTSALFGAGHLHNANATALGAFAIALEAGVLLGGAYMLTRSLWMPMGLHAAWNFTEGEVFDVPVSGLDQHGLVTAKLAGSNLLTGGRSDSRHH